MPISASTPRKDGWVPSVKVMVFIGCLLPLLRLSWLVLETEVVNPIELITHSTGTWTLVWLLVTLSISPARQLSGWGSVLRFRRMLGLYAFFYGTLHLMTYVWLDQFFDWAHILKDIAKRPFITVGFAALVLMTPLAVTSTQGWIKRLKKRWGQLHKLVYLVAPLGVLHYWWLVKRDITQPAIYASVLGVLLAFRAWKKCRVLWQHRLAIHSAGQK